MKSTDKGREIVLIIFICLLSCVFYGQNQKKSDSLIIQYQNGSYQNNELDLLRNIIENESDPSIVIEYSELLITRALLDSSYNYLHSAYLQKGNALTRMGNNSAGLKAYFKSLDYAKTLDDTIKIGTTDIAIAGTYASIKDYGNSIRYYKSGLQLLKTSNDPMQIATSLLNIGDLYITLGKLDSALTYTSEALLVFNKVNSLIGQAYSLGNTGMIYAEKGNDVIAEKNINHAIKILEELEDYYPISVYLTYMSDIYVRKKDFTKAVNYAQRSLDLAQKYGLKEQISDANLKLFEINQQKGNFEASVGYLQNYYTYRDSIVNIEAVEKMADLRTNYEVSQKQAEIDLKDAEVGLLNEKQRSQRVTLIATALGLGLFLILTLGLFRRNRFVQKTSDLIQKEKDRSDQLLLNILPEETALELKDNGKVIPKKFESVTVMFTDFEAFTKYSQNLTPELLVKSVDYYFSKFDEIIDKYGLEKIKTIGDSYMVAGGLPFPSEDHAQKMLNAAFEISEFIDATRNNGVREITRFDVRIGIHTGPVVAGVVGTKKFAYDIWGDTVNIASRLESNSEPGKINISDSTYKLVKDQYNCTYRGEIQAKNKGMMKMYFVEGKAPNQPSRIAI